MPHDIRRKIVFKVSPLGFNNGCDEIYCEIIVGIGRFEWIN